MTTTANDKAVNDAFLDLVYADQEAVDAEFDELIAASWEPPPPAPHAQPTPADRPAPPGSLPRAGPRVPGRSRPPRARSARQRSPPLY